MERLCLEDISSCNITSARFCDQKRKSSYSSSCSYTQCAILPFTQNPSPPKQDSHWMFYRDFFYVFLVAEKLQFSLCLIKYFTLRGTPEWKCNSRIRQLDPTRRWVVSCTLQTLYPLERCRRCLLDRRVSLLVWALWSQNLCHCRKSNPKCLLAHSLPQSVLSHRDSTASDNFRMCFQKEIYAECLFSTQTFHVLWIHTYLIWNADSNLG